MDINYQEPFEASASGSQALLLLPFVLGTIESQTGQERNRHLGAMFQFLWFQLTCSRFTPQVAGGRVGLNQEISFWTKGCVTSLSPPLVFWRIDIHANPKHLSTRQQSVGLLFSSLMNTHTRMLCWMLLCMQIKMDHLVCCILQEQVSMPII